MNRKGAEAVGELTLTVGKIFLVAFIIVAIVASFYKIANYYNTSVDEKNAKALIDSVVGKIDNLQEGESNTFLFQGIEDWYLIGWNPENLGKPDKCFFSSCLCICPNPNAESCQEKGICRDIGTKVEVNSSATLKYSMWVFFKVINNDLNALCISLSPVTLDIKINKSTDLVKVYHDYGFIEDKNAKNLDRRLNQCEKVYSKPSRIS